jgi:hypothetical protein
MLMKKTEVRAGSMLSFTHPAHVVSTFRYASILTTSSCSSQFCPAAGLLQNPSTKLLVSIVALAVGYTARSIVNHRHMPYACT